jgi:serine protease SohB
LYYILTDLTSFSPKGAKRRKKNKRKSRGEPESTPLGPVEQLYDDIYDDLSSSPPQSPLQKLFSMGSGGGGKSAFDKPTSKLNIGIPREYLKISKLNSKYDSYRYSMIKATKGKAVAAAELRSKSFENALGKALGVTSTFGELKLSSGEGTQLLQLERDFLKEGNELLAEAAYLSREITNAAVLEEMESMGVDAGVIDAIVNETVIDAVIEDKKTDVEGESSEKEENKPRKKKIEKQGDIMRAVKELEGINSQILLLEINFIQEVVEILGPNRADAIRTALVGNMINGEAGTLLKSLKERPLASIFSSFFNNEPARKNLYVTRFPGDVTASQLNELREEVTGILRAAQPGDEALLVLQSGGGTVTGYGLAAAQLLRLKQKGMKLTICVEQVAASGGYMMCCTADRIVASPFAVLGSIGVISEIPNAYERLKQEGIEFQTITAGKYKRTITPTKKITREDIKKSEEDIADILTLFKGFVKTQRPQLDIDNVATGETWFGEMALEKGLCDELATADDVLLEFVDNGYDVYEVAYNPPPEGIAALAGLPVGVNDIANGWKGALRSAVKSVVSEVKAEVVAELSANFNDVNSIEKRYMAKDPSDATNRIQMRD